MKNKKICSLVLAAGMLVGGTGFSTSTVYADTNNYTKKVVANEESQKHIINRACALIKVLENNPTEKNIKEARKLLPQLEDMSVKIAYKSLLDFYTNKNLDKNISPIDELIKACKITQKITSSNSNANFDMNLEGKDLSNEEKEALDNFLPILNSMNISMDLKLNTDGSNKKLKSSGVIHFKNSLIKFDSRIWVNVDVTKSIPQVKYIIEVPNALKVFLPKDLSNKQYLVYDLNNILNNPKIAKETKSIDINKVMELGQVFQQKFITKFDDFIKIADANYDIVSRIDKSKLNTNKLGDIEKAYEINLDNDKLVKVIKFALNDKDMVKVFSDYIDGLSSLTTKENNKIIENQKEDVVKSIEQSINKFNEAIKCDINNKIGVDKKGYTTFNKTTIKLSLNSKILMNLLGVKDAPKTNSKYTFTVNCDCNMGDVNKKIDLLQEPEINKENSVDYMDFIMNSLVQNK
ncbi:peptidoglycan-binding protein [Clostridium botulinum C/D str. BKT12695]|nr:peptidoglycan-binding protein [Clostridium botulinum C/D str. BKT12695]